MSMDFEQELKELIRAAIEAGVDRQAIIQALEAQGSLVQDEDPAESGDDEDEDDDDDD